MTVGRSDIAIQGSLVTSDLCPGSAWGASPAHRRGAPECHMVGRGVLRSRSEAGCCGRGIACLDKQPTGLEPNLGFGIPIATESCPDVTYTLPKATQDALRYQLTT